MFKTNLQELCHRRQWPLPVYASFREGPDHEPRFHATVTINGAAFHSLEPSLSSKEAQSKAAQVALENLSAAPPPPHSPPSPCLQPDFRCSHAVTEAEQSGAKVTLMSLPLEGNLQDDPVMYKNLLQELAQKEGLSMPKYTAINSGGCHMPAFTATVEINGECFQGDVARTKKQAEMNAAKVALSQLQKSTSSRLSSNLSEIWQMHVESEPATSTLEPMAYRNSLKTSDLLFAPKSVIQNGKADNSVAGYSNTVKVAEQSAAKATLMSLPFEGNPQDDPVMYKNLLQELAQKEGLLSMPKYTTISSGDYHTPGFTASVEIKGECFQGVVARTKKQAEMNAAKVALFQLQKSGSSRLSSNLPEIWQMHVKSEPATSTLEPIAYRNSLKTSDLLFAPQSTIQNEKTDSSIAAGHGATVPESTKSPLGRQIDFSAEIAEENAIVTLIKKPIKNEEVQVPCLEVGAHRLPRILITLMSMPQA